MFHVPGGESGPRTSVPCPVQSLRAGDACVNAHTVVYACTYMFLCRTLHYPMYSDASMKANDNRASATDRPEDACYRGRHCYAWRNDELRSRGGFAFGRERSSWFAAAVLPALVRIPAAPAIKSCPRAPPPAARIRGGENKQSLSPSLGSTLDSTYDGHIVGARGIARSAL